MASDMTSYIVPTPLRASSPGMTSVLTHGTTHFTQGINAVELGDEDICEFRRQGHDCID